MSQKFYADPTTRRLAFNGAVSYAPGGPMDCLGHFAKIQNCPVADTDLRRTCYATGYATDAFSVPASTKINGQHISGYFTAGQNGPVFHIMNRHKDRVAEALAVFAARKLIEEGATS